MNSLAACSMVRSFGTARPLPVGTHRRPAPGDEVAAHVFTTTLPAL
ncbi:hypothetical protein [Streptomyces sp. NPDC051704]